MRSFFCLYRLLTSIILIISSLSVEAARGNGPGDWLAIGSTNTGVSPYNFYYYKVAKINSDGHRYATTIELDIEGDANAYYMQGTYRIRINKYENTTGRFDGLEIRSISGNPSAATFYVFNDALWVRSNYQWGSIYYRTIDYLTTSPINTAPFDQTVTAPVGFVASTSTYGLKCDFDNNQYYQLSYEDVQGNTTSMGKMGIGTVPAYVLHTVAQGNTAKASAYLWGENYGVAVGTLNATATNYSFAVLNNANIDGSGATGGGKPLLYVRGDGNVGIGTNAPQAKLAVKGDIFAQKVKVTQSGWADFVFHPDYELPSLQEVERFIKVNKHLPEIPSEKEVEKEGLDVGEMNKKLLQKIEELTLYIIDLKKESVEQRRELEKLKDKIKNEANKPAGKYNR
ncbi:hypothetical protein [Chitinophaga ginsengisegetis]|uniref:hypothetical protein n=1 Tax=Chitinophaga ginsengisegetis TaxID=393003 RepID=UPI000DBAA235|nr:hypothetical protein [Chitinophaga ginsengisegetis]MDR6568840.1 hypothetical protein [Chitinophaga ginsengisegetis]MDR6649130.1 hypothetical protein [Chitinophaga ginsengisegetis]MDR6654921.1 hypothetical protein [Chitinophaga ginsengisegetis]